jgi:inorganic pyrophosphatase
MQLERIPPEAGRGQVHVLVDTPGGSANKYKLDDEYGVFRISRRLPEGMVFPHNFGSIPGTRAEDGDPLDVLVVGLPPAFPGCLITARLLGVLQARQVEGGKAIRNDRLVAVGETPVNRSPLRQLNDLPAQQLANIEHFFRSYNAAQGREFRILGRSGPRAAQTALRRAIRAFRQQAER